MEMTKYVLLMLMILFCYFNDVSGNCVLNLQENFGHPSPVYLQNGVFLAPNMRGEVIIPRAKKVTVACPGKGRFIVLGNDTTDFTVLEARCKKNVTFAVGWWEGRFEDIKCNGQPWVTSEQAGSCHGGNTRHRVGFKIGEQFYQLYEACFNKDLATTSYVKHNIQPTSQFIQHGGNRPQFIEGGLFGKVRMSKLYNSKHQRDRLNELLGEGMDAEYISKNQFLTRGHLAPRADYPLRAVQRATFHYVNTAPQWMRNNAGDWAALEEALRRRTFALNTTLDVYTGTWRVLTLADRQGRDTSLYLTHDDNNNGIVPVPMYFFKVVYDPKRKAALAFITINSSFYNSSTTERLTFCEDVCNDGQLPWLRWRADGAHSFCCTYQDFVKKVTFLPKLNVDRDFG